MSREALIECGLRIAVRAVVCDVECYGSRVHLPEPGRWYDTRPMLDPREQSPSCIDMAAEALHFGETTGALVRHPRQRHLVRVMVAPEPTLNG